MADDSLADRPLERRHRGATRRPGRIVRDVLIVLVAAIIVSFLVKTFVVRSFYIPSASMQNTLQIDDHVIVNELVPSIFPVERGDIVVFRDPGGWLDRPASETPTNPIAEAVGWVLSLVGLASSDSEGFLIKRVFGLPGDHVTCCTPFGGISINGALLQEPYVWVPEGEELVRFPFDVVVPLGMFLPLGDNRNHSGDFRYNRDKPGGGFVPVANVVGRAFLVTWPLWHWTWLDNYPDVFREIPGRESKALLPAGTR